MKYLVIPFLLLASLCWAGWVPVSTFNTSGQTISVLNQTDNAITIEISIRGFNVEEITENGETYKRISLVDYLSTSLDIGKAEIPAIAVNIGVPDNAHLNYEILDTETETFDDFNIYPFQKPTLDYSTDEPFVIDQDFYLKNINYQMKT